MPGNGNTPQSMPRHAIPLITFGTRMQPPHGPGGCGESLCRCHPQEAPNSEGRTAAAVPPRNVWRHVPVEVISRQSDVCSCCWRRPGACRKVVSPCSTGLLESHVFLQLAVEPAPRDAAIVQALVTLAHIWNGLSTAGFLTCVFVGVSWSRLLFFPLTSRLRCYCG